MSWLSRLNEIELTIVTGDGKEYRPLWKNASRTVNFNVKGFDFVGIEGTFVQREQKSGTQYPIELYFKGENCIDIAREFEISARDKRPWVVTHPFYDEIRVQPLRLRQSDENYNISRIDVEVWETLSEKFPQESVIPEKQIQSAKLESDEIVLNSYDVSPDTSLIEKATSAINSIELSYTPLAQSVEDVAELRNLVNAAQGAAIELVSAPLNFIRDVQSLINFPFQVINTVQNKVNQLIESIENLLGIFIPDETGSLNEVDLATYDALVSTTITELCNVTTNANLTDKNDYAKRADVVNIINQVDSTYQQVLLNFDNNSYAQNPDVALSVDNIVNATLANLFEVAFNSQQERTINLEKDDNVINLAHRFYGGGDDNITRVIDENELNRAELLQVKKGRKLVWYV